MTGLNQIDLADLDQSLRDEIAPFPSTGKWTAFELPFEQATVSNQRYQIVFNPAYGRGGIVFCGSGSDGSTSWTDAKSAEDVLARFLADDMSP